MTEKVTLITGASAGLGVEFARQLSTKGQRLVLAARRKERLDALATKLGDARVVAMDLAEPGAVERLLDDIRANDEHVDCLINNAGFGQWGRFADQEPARIGEMIDLNVRTLTELCRAVVPPMIKHQQGRILNVASTAAFQPGPGMAVYFATKAFVLSFTEALHEELKAHGIRVSCLCPGPTRTEFGDVAGFGNHKLIDRLGMDAAPVVRLGLAALEKNKAVEVTGVLNKTGAALTRFVPRGTLRRIAGSIKY